MLFRFGTKSRLNTKRVSHQCSSLTFCSYAVGSSIYDQNSSLLQQIKTHFCECLRVFFCCFFFAEITKYDHFVIQQLEKEKQIYGSYCACRAQIPRCHGPNGKHLSSGMSRNHPPLLMKLGWFQELIFHLAVLRMKPDVHNLQLLWCTAAKV